MRLNARFLALVSLAVVVALGSTVASAQGLHLKLSADASQVTADQPVKLKMAAVALRSLDLPATPEFLIDDGSGLRPRPDLAAKALAGAQRIEVTPDKSWTGDYELTLAKPGTYKIQAEYRVNDRMVRSNKVTVQVVAAGTERAAQ